MIFKNLNNKKYNKPKKDLEFLCKDKIYEFQSPINIISSICGNKKINIKYSGFEYEVIDKITTLEFFSCSKDNIVFYDNQVWNLEQFHFHNPSEHKIDGKGALLEVHFVNKNEQGDILVIANFINQGEENNEFGDAFITPKNLNVKIDLVKIFNLKGRFYSFDGSLTQPPYKNGVKWVLMEEPVLFSQRQIEQFTSRYIKNARKIQPLNNRKVYKN